MLFKAGARERAHSESSPATPAMQQTVNRARAQPGEADSPTNFDDTLPGSPAPSVTPGRHGPPPSPLTGFPRGSVGLANTLDNGSGSSSGSVEEGEISFPKLDPEEER